MKQVVPGFYEVALGTVNVFLLDHPNGLVLFDTGTPGMENKIFDAIRELGKQPADLRHIVITHCHPDHIGSLAAVQRATSAQTYVHPLDANWIKRGGDFDPVHGDRPFKASPGLLNKILFKLFIKPYRGLEAAQVDMEINDGDRLPFAPDIQVIFAPGHSVGEIALLWEKHGGVLIAGDTAANLPALSYSIGYENFADGQRSLKKICQFNFEAAVFGHGSAIKQGAGAKWRKKWSHLPG